MISKQYWPFDVAPADQLSSDGKWFVGFLGSAFRNKWKAYMMEESIVGAEAENGRGGEVVRRGGRGRWWEIVLAENGEVLESRFVDGFEPAAEAVFSWLRGDPVAAVLERIQDVVVERPRGLDDTVVDGLRFCGPDGRISFWPPARLSDRSNGLGS